MIKRNLYNHIFDKTMILDGYRGSIAHNLHIPREADSVFGIDDIDYFSIFTYPLNYYLSLESYNHAGDVEGKKIEENDLVAQDDIVIHLGDVILGRNSELFSIMEQLKGKKILCRGNHDHESDQWYTKRGFDFVCDYYVYNNIAFSHAPLTPLPMQTMKQHSKDEGFVFKTVDLNIHGHFHRGKHRGQPGMRDRYYSNEYFEESRKKYHLVQIEDTLSPVLLSDILAKHELENL